MRRATLAAMLMFTANIATAQEEHTKDTTEQVKKAVADKKAVLVDVREQKEWDAGHLKDAKLFSLSKLNEKTKKEDIEKVIPKGTVVYLHCKAGGRCLTAAEVLKKHGYDARAMKSGYDDLLKAGFPKAE